MESFIPQRHSETLVIIGAGSTATLKSPTTADQTKIFRELSDSNDDASQKKALCGYFSGGDLEKVHAFLNLLYGEKGDIENISDADLKNAEILYGKRDEKIIRKRISELRHEYDWNAAKKIMRLCPQKRTDGKDNLVVDMYSIIDSKLLSKQSLRVQNDDNPKVKKEETLETARLIGARNFMVLFLNMMASSAYKNLADKKYEDRNADYEKCRKFLLSFDRLMQKEGAKFLQKGYKPSSRDFYLFSTSFVCFNFEMIFAWLMMASHNDRDVSFSAFRRERN